MGGNSMRMRQRPIGFGGWAALAVVGLIEIVAASTAGAVTWQDEIGYTSLVAQLTAASATIPTGAGVNVMQAEASASTSTTICSPDPSNSAFQNIAFTYQGSATSTAISGHATTVGTYFYGTSSIAPGITNVAVIDADSWMNTYLFGTAFNQSNQTHNGGTTTTTYTLGTSPALSADVVNCSWIGTSSNATTTLQLLDHSINQNDYVCVVGTDNGSGSALPDLLAQSYNTISVGLSNGDHSHGATTLNGTGRIKPDIVAPASATSWATGMVSSASAMLISAAGSLSTGSTDAKHSQTIKAILLAGATKTTLPSWSHTHTSPLDSTYGAGELNVLRSYGILTGGEQTAGGEISKAGWDYNSLSSASNKLYNFNVAAGSALGELSAVLTWNAEIGGIATVVTYGGNSTTTTSLTTTLADLNLNLYKVTTVAGLPVYTLVDYSNSAVDNVELLYETSLAAGDYAFEVTSSSAANTAYALAWTMTVPEPGTLALLLAAASVAVVFHRRRKNRA